MIILGIDPGPNTHGIVEYFVEAGFARAADSKADWSTVIAAIDSRPSVVAIEAIEAMYAHVGKETVRTIRNIGRLEQYAEDEGIECVTLSPQDVKRIVCGTAAAKDPAVRQALLDKIGPQGRKAEPGPTYGVSGHAWRALAVAYAAHLTMQPQPTTTN